jgi:hypothetical protein
MKFLRIALVVAVITLAGCVTHIRPTVTFNAPPTHALHDYQSFEVKPLSADRDVKEEKAMAKIRENLDQKLGALLASWNHGAGETLIIEPRVRELKFVGGAGRFFAGAMAGSSAVRMTVTLRDKRTGEVIGEPEFYQRAAAYGAAYSFGGTDNAMLARITTVVDEYLRRNYDRAVGGPTGLEASNK